MAPDSPGHARTAAALRTFGLVKLEVEMRQGAAGLGHSWQKKVARRAFEHVHIYGVEAPAGAGVADCDAAPAEGSTLAEAEAISSLSVGDM